LTRDRGRSRRARIGLEALEPRTLLSGGGPADWTGSEALGQLLPQTPEAAAEIGSGRIGQALVIATPTARTQGSLEPPSSGEAARAAYTWIIDQVDFHDAKPDLASLAGSSLILADEGGSAHATLGEALPMDATRPVLVHGVVGAGEGADFYRISTGRPQLRISFHPSDPGSPMADRIALYDETGRMVADWALPPTAEAMSVELSGTDNQPGHELYVGISPAGEGGNSGVGESYVLLVEPIDRDGSSPPDRPDLVSPRTPAPTEKHEEAIPPPSAGSQQPTERAASPVPDSPLTSAAGTAGIGQGGVGPLPVLSAAPFGGILDGDPLMGSSDAVDPALDLALTGLLDDAPAGDSSRGDGLNGPLISVTVGSDLPLVAAARAHSVDAEPRTPGDGELLVVPRPAPSAELPGAAPERRSRPALVRRTILPLGLGLLATLATTFRLADPIVRDRAAPAQPRRPLPDWLRRWLAEAKPEG
jgi:hypothetical protein